MPKRNLCWRWKPTTNISFSNFWLICRLLWWDFQNFLEMFLNYHKVLETSVKDHFWNDYLKVSGWKLLIAKTLILDFIICEIFLPTTVSQTLDPENLYLFLFLPFTLNFSITSLFRILNKLNALCAFHKKKKSLTLPGPFYSTLFTQPSFNAIEINKFPFVK